MKLMIKENVITDLKSKGILNVNDEVKRVLLDSFGINVNDCTLVPCRPRSYMAAKSNPNVILGICSNYHYRMSWRDNGKDGPVVYAIFGRNDFRSVLGDDRIRYDFAQCDTFYEIIPTDPETYKGSLEPLFAQSACKAVEGDEFVGKGFGIGLYCAVAAEALPLVVVQQPGRVSEREVFQADDRRRGGSIPRFLKVSGRSYEQQRTDHRQR